MGYCILGVHHKTCPVAVRERLMFTAQSAGDFLDRWAAEVPQSEAMLVSTCARTEVYIWCEEQCEEGALERVRQELISIDERAAGYLSLRSGTLAVDHAFRLVSGLESQIIGEFEIVGQVRAAMQQARVRATLGPHLDALFSTAVRVNRRLRKETKLGQTDTSVAATSRSLVESVMPLADARVLIIGSGRVARMLVSELRPAGRIAIASRTYAASSSVAESMGIEVLVLEEALNALDQFNVLACATRTNTPVVKFEHIKAAGPLLVLDLAVPRNVDMAVSSAPGIKLFDIDSVRPQAAIESFDPDMVSSILEAEVHDFLGRENIKQVADIIGALREHVDRVRNQELVRVQGRLAYMSPSDRAVVESLTQRLIDKMFHHLVVRLRLAALSDPDLVRAAEFFFAHGNEGLFPEPEQAALDIDKRTAIES